MRSILSRIGQDIRDYYKGVIILLIYYIVVHGVFHAFCPLLIFTGFPCAGCGMTRALGCVLTGQLSRAMSLNPSVFAWVAWVLFFMVERYALGRQSKWVWRLLAVVCVITLVIYVYRMATQFPGEPPMTYYHENIMSKILKIL